MKTQPLSPLCAVLFWPNESESAEKAANHILVQFGMKHFVYEPLGLSFPEDSVKYTHDAIRTFRYVLLQDHMNPDEYERYIKRGIWEEQENEKRDREGILNEYYHKIVEVLASQKSNVVTDHVIPKTSIPDITPLPCINISDLKYSEETISAVHRIAYTMMPKNPTWTYCILIRFMNILLTEIEQGVPISTHGNLYLNMYLYMCGKACMSSKNIRLIPFVKKVPTAGVCNVPCFGPYNEEMGHIMQEIMTIKFCLWCHKPVNIAFKKKMGAGGAHKSQLFTNEYTNEILYCTEKNNRGIVKFPMLSVHPLTHEFYTNEISWYINNTCNYKIYTNIDEDQEENGHKKKWVLRVHIINNATNENVVTPIKLKHLGCEDVPKRERCVFCQSKCVGE